MADYHEPVMLTECLDGLSLREDGAYVDCTWAAVDIPRP